MFYKRVGFPMFLAIVATAIAFGALGWDGAQAASHTVANRGILQQTTPMTHTMPITDTMPMTGAMLGVANGAPGTMPMQPTTGQPSMGVMMANMPMMQGMDMGGMMMGGQGGAQDNDPAAAGKPVNAAAAPQTGKLGEIEIKVTPPDLTNIQGETIDFAVDLNATGADLSFDLAPLATLLIGDHKMPAEAWEVTLDHGHHVAGVLKFPAHMQGASGWTVHRPVRRTAPSLA